VDVAQCADADRCDDCSNQTRNDVDQF
jgi:hypothetical protein